MFRLLWHRGDPRWESRWTIGALGVVVFLGVWFVRPRVEGQHWVIYFGSSVGAGILFVVAVSLTWAIADRVKTRRHVESANADPP